MSSKFLITSSKLQSDPSAVVELIRNDHIGVLPTDTIYGLVASALSETAIERLYQVRRRTPSKPFIILISTIDDLKLFGITLTSAQQEFLSEHWPNPLSIILPVPDPQWHFLHRGTKSLAFRLPDKPELVDLLSQTGPLVAPSANFEDQPPAKTIQEAKKYFGNELAFYVDAGKLTGQPSTLISFEENKPVILRQGSYYLNHHS